ncbi:MAG: hypothetical protein ACI97A_001293 [Planctomycetota bacterium]|jgi:hypothetical protein
MNRIFTALIVFSIFTATVVAQDEAKPKAETVKFTAKKVAVGDRVLKGSKAKSAMNMNMSMGEMGEQEMNQGLNGSETKTVTILEVKDDKVTKFSVEYREMKAETSMESPMLPEPMIEDPMAAFDLAGNTYTYTIADDGVKVVDSKGEALPDDKAKLLTELETPGGKFGAWNPNAAEMFTKREITIGETVVIPKEKAMSLLPSPELLGKSTSFKCEATLVAKKNVFGVACGVFDIVMAVEGEPKMPGGDLPGMVANMTLKLTGSITIGVDNMWIYAAKTTGPVNIEASGEIQEGMNLTVTGKGTTSSDVLNVYSKAKPAEQK